MATTPPASRRARLERTRRLEKIFIVTAVIVVIAGSTTYAVLRHDDADAVTRPGVHTVATSSLLGTGPTDSSTATRHRPVRRLSHTDPLRVWVGGDSLSGELGPALGTMLSPTGVVQVTVDFRVGSGLHDNGIRNWPQRAPDQMTKYNPDVAVFMIGANDASIVGGDVNVWSPKYREKVAAMMDLLGGEHHRPVLWVGPPTMGSTRLDHGARELGALMADEATKHRGVTYVDAYTLFAGADGSYANHLDLSALRDSAGGLSVEVKGDLTRVLVRISDGVHFTVAGADWMAFAVAKVLDERWWIVRQSGGEPIRVTIEGGGGSIPGYQAPSTSTSSNLSTTSSTPESSTSTTIVDGSSTTTSVDLSTTTIPTATSTTSS